MNFTSFEILLLLVAYLLGSLPFGLMLVRLSGIGDLRKYGSGNIGATNVLRTGRKDLAAFTLFLDAGKGAAAFLFVSSLTGQKEVALLAGLAVFVGHLYPITLGFRGGKGVATGFGVLLAAEPFLALVACLAWLLTLFVSKISSLAALVSMACASVYALILKDTELSFLVLTMTLLSLLKHRGNISRLLKGREPKVR